MGGRKSTRHDFKSWNARGISQCVCRMMAIILQMPFGWINMNSRNSYSSTNFLLILWQVGIKIPEWVRAEMPCYRQKEQVEGDGHLWTRNMFQDSWERWRLEQFALANEDKWSTTSVNKLRKYSPQLQRDAQGEQNTFTFSIPFIMKPLFWVIS